MRLNKNTKLNPTSHSSYTQTDTTYKNSLSKMLYCSVETAIILNIFGVLFLGLPSKNEKTKFPWVMGYSPFTHFLFTSSYPQFGTLWLVLPTSQTHCWLYPQPGDISERTFVCVGFELKTSKERASCRLTLGALRTWEKLSLENLRKGTNFEIHMCAINAPKSLSPLVFNLDL